MKMEFSAYGRTRLADIKLHGVRNLQTGRFTVTGMTIDGQLTIPSRKFWDNLFRRFGLTDGWAENKSHARRFEWLVAHYGEYEIPYLVCWDLDGEAELWPAASMKMRRPKRVLRKRRRTEPAGLSKGRCRTETTAKDCSTQNQSHQSEPADGYESLLARLEEVTSEKFQRIDPATNPSLAMRRRSRLSQLFGRQRRGV